MDSLRVLFLMLLLGIILSGCNPAPEYEENANQQGHTAPTPVTQKANKAVLKIRPFANTNDFANANKGLIKKEKNLKIKHAVEGLVWDMTQYEFIDSKGENSPASINPSLWRQAALNNIHGLFKVTDGIYQIRGYDLANMSIISSKNGWIIVDPLTTKETASRALTFAQQHLGKHPIKAIIFTHSHIDHFGGIQGILTHLKESEKSQLKIIAPEGFTQEATSENIIAGTAMSRRAMFMYGKQLARNQRGHIGTGLGKGPAFGSFGFIEPTDFIAKTGTQVTIDGIPIVFQMVSGSEAPAEFTFYLPSYKAFCGAELVSHNLHNLYTLRGAKVRDARRWSQFIEEARTSFAEAEVYFASHHWPLWGQRNINDFLIQQRDTYKFIHDQSVRLLNQGLTPNEIADAIQLPPELNQSFHNQSYYGTVKHNAKAIYQAYMGWFTANPSQLNPLPEAESAQRYMEMMGGVDVVVAKAQKQFESANNMSVKDGTRTYRWLAELLNHAVFADPDHTQAKMLLAKIYDQLGYQAEAATWRDFYLMGAYELRHGSPEEGISPAIMKEVLQKTPVNYFFESMAVRLNSNKAIGKNLTIKITFTDLKKSYLLKVNNSVLHHREASDSAPTNATLRLTHPLFIDILVGQTNLKDLLFTNELSLEGSKIDLLSFFSLLDRPQGTFNIVTP